jgi:hypothetical protein
MRTKMPVLLLSLTLFSSAHSSLETLNVTINNTVDLQDVRLVWLTDSTSIFGPNYYGKGYVDITAGSTLAAGTHSFAFSVDNFFSLPDVGYSIFADYSGRAGATIAFDPAAAATYIGNPWPFDTAPGPAQPPSPFVYESESTFLSALATNNADQFDKVADWLRIEGALAPTNGNSTLINFSDGVSAGSAHLDVVPAAVPEPSSVVAVGVGIVGLLGLRRRIGR